jgi:hypothetical protein
MIPIGSPKLGSFDSDMFDRLYESALGDEDGGFTLIETVKDRTIRICTGDPILFIFWISKDDIVVQMRSGYCVDLS